MWRLCFAAEKLREQLNTLVPNRSKVSDGSIGDAAHASRNSDHNPWIIIKENGKEIGIVSAIDVTHNLERGIDCNKLKRVLVAGNDSRIKYLIFDGKITNHGNLNDWVPYHGPNAHRHHLHISFKSDQKLFDSRKAWALAGLVDKNVITTPAVQIAQVLPPEQHLSTPATVPIVPISEIPPIPPPPETKEVDIPKQRPSLITNILTGISYLIGIGFSVGGFLQSRLEALSNKQVLTILGFLGLAGLAMYFRHQSAERANRENLKMIEAAKDPTVNTPILRG